MTTAEATAEKENNVTEKDIEAHAKSQPIIHTKKDKTALESRLDDEELNNLVEFAEHRRLSYAQARGKWITQMELDEMQMDDDFDWRKTERNPVSGDIEIWSRQNDSMNIVGTLHDFIRGQAKNDILGSTPFYAIEQEGDMDSETAQLVQDHSYWKLRQTRTKCTAKDAIDVALGQGLAVIKPTYRREVDFWEELVEVLVEKKTGNAVLTSSGRFVYQSDVDANGDFLETDEEGLWVEDPELVLGDPNQYQWESRAQEQQEILFDNVESDLCYYKDLFFDMTAPEMTLRHTDIFHAFSLRIEDVKDRFNIDPQIFEDRIRGAVEALSAEEQTRDHLPEEKVTSPETGPNTRTGEDRNPKIRLYEAYMRLKLKPDDEYHTRLHMVYWPIDSGEYQTRFDGEGGPGTCLIMSLKYMAETTPKGKEPFYALAPFKRPGRFYGPGLFYIYREAQRIVDSLYSNINYRNRKHANPTVGINPSALRESEEEASISFDPDSTVELKDGYALDDFVQYKEMPDLDKRSMEILQLTVQVVQLRSGVTSASSGELEGVPQSQTATGIRQLMTRAAVLMKQPIDTIQEGIAKALQYSLMLIYENIDMAETFVWGEGDERVMQTLTPEMVDNMRFDVKLTMTQSMAEEKLQQSQAAVEFMSQYLAFPEWDKESVRDLFVQALEQLKFENAEQIVRPAFSEVADWEMFLGMLPADIQEPFAMFLMQQGLWQPEQLEGEGEQPPSE